ncbi:MAG TPA: hypothetical protein PLG73_02470 [Candidatus Sumerlaeota bacterium]|nr:hypothetical protein [Candidatus Sumerlaeota bacterium]
MKSLKTTVLGICTILAALALAGKALLDGDPSTAPDIEALSVAITSGIGLIVARDNDKSSERVGAK